MGGWELPCWPLHVRASTYSIVDETARAGAPKFWTTNHMSWPHWGMMMDETGSFIESINGSIDRLRWPTNRLPQANHRQHLALTTTRGEAVSASASVRKRTHTWSYAQWSAKNWALVTTACPREQFPMKVLYQTGTKPSCSNPSGATTRRA
jgi:hypothetical protein